LPPAPPLRVLYCEGNTDGTIGGSYYSLLYLVEGLRATRYQPFVVFHREHALLPRFAQACPQVYVIPKAPPIQLLAQHSSLNRLHPVLTAPVLLLQRALNSVKFLTIVIRHARFLRTHAIALLHLNNSVTRTHDWMLAAWLTRTPCVVHERGINDRFPFLARFFAPRVSAVICISDAVRENLIKHRVAQGNLRVIPNGLDPTRIVPRRDAEEVRRALRIDERRRVIGLIGNIKEWKGQEIVIRALPAIAAKVPGVVCLFVGTASDSDRDYKNRLQDLIAQLRVEEYVIFTDYWENVADVLNLMEVSIHASTLPEPFGRVLLEAMAMKKPVVGSRSGAVPEIVEHGVTGFTFAPGNPSELASHVIQLLDHPTTARAFGEAGYARLLERFHITENVSQTLRLYGEILDTTGFRVGVNGGAEGTARG